MKTIKTKTRTNNTPKIEANGPADGLGAPAPRKRSAKETAAAPVPPAAEPAPVVRALLETRHADTSLAAPRRQITTELIATRAYIIWEKQGCPHGRDVANWLLAEQQLKEEVQSLTA